MISFTASGEFHGIPDRAEITIGPGPSGSLLLTIAGAQLEGGDWFGLAKKGADTGIAGELNAKGVKYTRISDNQFALAIPQLFGFSIECVDTDALGSSPSAS